MGSEVLVKMFEAVELFGEMESPRRLASPGSGHSPIAWGSRCWNRRAGGEVPCWSKKI